MADHCRRTCESSGDWQNTTTTDLASSSASATSNPNEPCDGKGTNWARTFFKDQERFTKWNTNLSQVSPKGNLGRSLILPSIPEESEAHGERSAIGKDGDHGQGNERKNFVVLVSDENGSVATVNGELLKNLKTRLTCDNNEQVDISAPQMNQTNDTPSNDANDADFRKRRKLLVNRISSKKCRIKKIQRLADMERHVKNLENHVETMKFQIKAHEHNQRLLKADNSLTKVKMTALEERSRLIAMEIELKQDEVERLRAQVECIQQLWPIIDNILPTDYYLLNQQPATATLDSTLVLPNGTTANVYAQSNRPAESNIPDRLMPAITAALEEASLAQT